MKTVMLNLSGLIFSSFGFLFATSVAGASDRMDRLDRQLVDRTMRMMQQEKVQPHDGMHILVEPGEDKEAIAYYQRITPKLNFDILKSSLDSLLVYLGYEGLTAEDVEYLPSNLLMPVSAADYDKLAGGVANPALFRARFQLGDFSGDAVLVSRFFAPKIVNFGVRDNAQSNPFAAGWRKLVRLTPRPGSAAATAGLGAAYILFNYFEADPSVDPFSKDRGKESGNNQVILVPNQFVADQDDSVYWLVYQARKNKYAVGLALNAGFDLPVSPDQPTQDYFVPRACAQCHGHDAELGGPSAKGTFPYGKVNYLDTDQWYDMMNFDFPGTKASPFDVLFDAGKDVNDPIYKRAFSVLRTLNATIVRQNEASKRPGPDNPDAYKLAAVNKWLEIHAKSDAPVPQSERSLSINGGKLWGPGADEQRLLSMLNQYCFRCHSSMYYNVFDRAAVVDLKRSIERRVNNGSMPQGRVLEPNVKAELIDLVRKLQN